MLNYLMLEFRVRIKRISVLCNNKKLIYEEKEIEKVKGAEKIKFFTSLHSK